MSETQGEQQEWGDGLADWDVIFGAVLEPEAYLAEPEVTGQAGSYWQPTTDLEEDPQGLAAWEREVGRAIAVLDGLLSSAGKARSDRSRAMRLAAVDRALADPRSGYLRRLRRERSAIMRARHAAGTPVKQLATEARVSPARVRQLMANNRTYVSADRQIALAALRRESAAKREADREAARVARASKSADENARRAAARIAEGRRLAGRIAAGASRDDLQAELGWSRQKLANLLAEAARADAAATSAEQVAA